MLKTMAIFILLINAYFLFKIKLFSGRYISHILATILVTLLELIFGVVFGSFFQVNHYDFSPVRLDMLQFRWFQGIAKMTAKKTERKSNFLRSSCVVFV